jgi:hypothetical protein
MKIEKKEVTSEVESKVTDYVYDNYEKLKGKPLRIRETSSCFYVYKHDDGGPMILGKEIIS